MTGSLSTYLPQDRYRALLTSKSLPEVTQGAALFADISGFTSLTEQLAQKLGARRGIEELTRRINAVYQPLIAEIDRFGGSVISFAGDSITCWFDEKDGQAVHRAVTSAQRMQTTMQAFQDLTLKIAITAGHVRRLVVGNPSIQLMDTVAGATVVRLASGEHLAKQGEVLLDKNAVLILGEAITIGQWVAAEMGERFAKLADLVQPQPPYTIQMPVGHVDDEVLRPWVPPIVFEREQRGLGAFLTELRPATALFVRFSGIDYDADNQAGERLDTFVRHVQGILERFEGNLIQLTLGDKGSYLYATFGVPIIHEDDALRASQAAWELSQLVKELDYLTPLQIGISKGTMRAGAYGSTTRLTYGALGDDTNLAARLMTTAAPGEILVSGRVYKLIQDHFNCEPRPPLPMKGKAEPLPVFALTGPRRHRAVRLEEPTYTLPMMGRLAELKIIRDKLNLARQGSGQIIGILAEAGMGKSRLVAETIRLAHRIGFTGFGGACEASGINTPYLVWRPIWQAFFNLDLASSPRRHLRNLEGEIEDRAPARLQAIPVLAALLEMEIEENEFTRTLESKDRQNVLTALLEDCLKSAGREEPLLMVLEDVHWIDPLSHDLLESLARVCFYLPVCIVLTYRPLEARRLQKEQVEALPHFTRIELQPLIAEETELMIRAKLAQFYPEQSAALPRALVDQLTSRAEGNPFFIEELLNYLRDCGLNPYEINSLQSFDLPSSLHALLLSRIDQLTEVQKTTLKVASIIGRLFRVSWLQGYYPYLGQEERIRSSLSDLTRLDLTALDTSEPELAYLFKHILTREVAYESLAYATRAQLHDQLAQYLETLGQDRYLYLIAYHYGLSENKAKQVEYLNKAGDAAKADYANEAALEYYQQLAPLLEKGALINLHLNRGEIFELINEFQEAETEYREALKLSQQTGSILSTIRSQKALGTRLFYRGELSAALELLKLAKTGTEEAGDWRELSQVLIAIGRTDCFTSDIESAQECFQTSLILARKNNDQKTEAQALFALGTLYLEKGNYPAAQEFTEKGLQLVNAIGDRHEMVMALNTLGLLASYQGDQKIAQAYYEKSLSISREIGDKSNVVALINNLALIAHNQGNFVEAQALYEECLTDLEPGFKRRVAFIKNNLGVLAADQADFATARMRFEESLLVWRELGDKLLIADTVLNLGYLDCEQGNFPQALISIKECLKLYLERDNKMGIIYSLVGLSAVSAAQGDFLISLKLASGAEAMRSSINLTLFMDGSRLYTRTISTCRQALSEADFDAAWETGKLLSYDKILALVEPPA